MARNYPPIRPFAVRFAAEYKAFMIANGVRGAQIAEVLGRNEGYVSERVNGKRPLDTDDVDALASLVPGWDGMKLMIELSRRAQDAAAASAAASATDAPSAAEVLAATAEFTNELWILLADRYPTVAAFREALIDGGHRGAADRLEAYLNDGEVPTQDDLKVYFEFLERRADYEAVANDSIEEFPAHDDADFDHA